MELREVLAAAPEPKPQVPDFGAKRAIIAARRTRLVRAVAAGKLALDDIDASIAELADVELAAAEHAARSGADTVEVRRAELGFVAIVSNVWAGLLAGERRAVLGSSRSAS